LWTGAFPEQSSGHAGAAEQEPVCPLLAPYRNTGPQVRRHRHRATGPPSASARAVKAGWRDLLLLARRAAAISPVAGTSGRRAGSPLRLRQADLRPAWPHWLPAAPAGPRRRWAAV